VRQWRRSSAGVKLLIVAGVLVVLSLAALVVKNHAGPDAAQRAPERTIDTPDATPVAKALPLGTSTEIGSDYRVAVTDVTVYEAGGTRFVAARIKAEYTGKKDGAPWADLNVEFSDADGHAFDEASCPVDLGDDADPPALAPGDVQTYTVCTDMPANKTDGGKVTVEEAYADTARKAWSTDEAVTKSAPSPTATPQAEAPAQVPPRPQQQSSSNQSDDSDLKERCDDLSDQVRDYKKYVDKTDKQIDWYKQQPNYDSDKVDDYEDWKHKMQKNIDQYEKSC
jgi:hypothetical protein